MHDIRHTAGAVLLAAAVAAPAAYGNTVKITPLGSHDGEFCRFDRAMVLEDPDGTRLLFDAGRTVAGADDPRLGRAQVLVRQLNHARSGGFATAQDDSRGPPAGGQQALDEVQQ